MRRPSQRTKSVGRAAFLVPLAALVAAAGCTSAGPASTASATAPASTTSAVGTHPHSLAEKVPVTAYLSVEQNYDVQDKDGHPGQLRYSVTDPKTIAQLTALINALPVSANQGITPCPESMAPAFDLEFSAAKGNKAVAEVSLQCFGVMVAVGDHNLPILSYTATAGGMSFVKRIEALLAPYAHQS